MFDGRIAEDFKLVTGTWVTVGRLRAHLVSEAGGLLSDAVIAGHDRAEVAALAWVNELEVHRAFGENVQLDDPRLRQHVTEALRRLNAGAGSASCIKSVLLLDEPPDLDAGEITDKGYVNQRRVLARRADDVERLYAEPPDPAVIVSPR
jgi:feruloyl-CoA synthase